MKTVLRLALVLVGLLPVADRCIRAADSPAASPAPSLAADPRQDAEFALNRFFPPQPLDPAVRARLIQLVVDSRHAVYTIMDSARASGRPADETIGPGLENIRQFNRDVITLLGPEQGRYFIDVYRSTRFVPLATDFAEQCAAMGEPLSARAVSAIAIDLFRYLRPPELYQDARITPSVARTLAASAHRDAATVLTLRQLALFDQFFAEHPFPIEGHRTATH
jgi:hypothetical protein